MNLQQLEYISALNKLRHFGKAADYCKVTQPTLSTMIQKLEDELGVKLFERSRQHVTPTSIGLKVISQAEEVLRQSTLISDIINDEKDELKGHVNISILPTIAPYLLPRVLPELSKRLPNLKITFTELITSESITALLNNNIDMAIIASSMEHNSVKETKLYYEEFMGYVSENEELYTKDAIRSSEVDCRNLWILDEGHCFRDQLVRFCSLRKQVDRQFIYSRGSLETFIHMVDMGSGITFVPELFAIEASECQKKHVRPFMIPRPTRAITMCVKKDYIRESICREIIDIIQKSVPKEMLSLRVGQSEV